MSLLDTQMLEAGIAALSHRLSIVEQQVKAYGEVVEMRQKLSEDPFKNGRIATVLATRLNPLCDKVARIEAQMGLKQRLPITSPLPPSIEVPQDLRMIKGKNGKKKNRTAEVVQRRWQIWQMQHEAGIPLIAIARAWGCDHGSICYAMKRNWRVGGKTRGEK